MQKALHMKATVKSGGRVVVVNEDLKEGQTVDVVVFYEDRAGRPSKRGNPNADPQRRLL